MSARMKIRTKINFACPMECEQSEHIQWKPDPLYVNAGSVKPEWRRCFYGEANLFNGSLPYNGVYRVEI